MQVVEIFVNVEEIVWLKREILVGTKIQHKSYLREKLWVQILGDVTESREG